MVVILAKDLKNLAHDIHSNENRKWWYNPDNVRLSIPKYQISMLVISELAEAMEGYRKNLKDDKLQHYPMFYVELADTCIRLMDAMEAFSANSKDCNLYDYRPEPVKRKEPLDFLNFCVKEVIKIFDEDKSWHKNAGFYWNIIYTIFDFCYENNYDIFQIIKEKREFNQTRKDHSFAERSKENGKKF